MLRTLSIWRHRGWVDDDSDENNALSSITPTKSASLLFFFKTFAFYLTLLTTLNAIWKALARSGDSTAIPPSGRGRGKLNNPNKKKPKPSSETEQENLKQKKRKKKAPSWWPFIGRESVHNDSLVVVRLRYRFRDGLYMPKHFTLGRGKSFFFQKISQKINKLYKIYIRKKKERSLFSLRAHVLGWHSNGSASLSRCPLDVTKEREAHVSLLQRFTATRRLSRSFSLL